MKKILAIRTIYGYVCGWYRSLQYSKNVHNFSMKICDDVGMMCERFILCACLVCSHFAYKIISLSIFRPCFVDPGQLPYRRWCWHSLRRRTVLRLVGSSESSSPATDTGISIWQIDLLPVWILVIHEPNKCPNTIGECDRRTAVRCTWYLNCHQRRNRVRRALRRTQMWYRYRWPLKWIKKITLLVFDDFIKICRIHFLPASGQPTELRWKQFVAECVHHGCICAVGERQMRQSCLIKSIAAVFEYFPPFVGAALIQYKCQIAEQLFRWTDRQ